MKEAELLILHLLMVDPNDRLNVAQAIAPSEILSRSDLMRTLMEFKEFDSERVFKGAVHAVKFVAKAQGWNDNIRNQNMMGKEIFYQLYIV